MVFCQVFLRNLLNWPPDDQAALIGFLGFGDYVEVDMRNHLEGHPESANVDHKRTYSTHLVGNLAVVLDME